MKKCILSLILGFSALFYNQPAYAETKNTSTVQEVAKDVLVDGKLMKSITPEQLEEYIAHGADVNAKDDDGYTPLMSAASNSRNPAVIETLIKHGAVLEAKTNRGGTPLMFAAGENQNPKIVKTLIQHGANIEDRNIGGMTSLMVAASKNKNSEIIETLIRYGAKINSKDEDGSTPLIYAASNNPSPEIIATFIKYGADVNVKDKDGFTALTYAALYNTNPKVIQALIYYGAPVDDGKKLLALLDKNKNIERNKNYWNLRNMVNNGGSNLNKTPRVYVKKRIVEVVKVYDCSSIGYCACGILENKTSSEQSVTVYAHYYDKDEIKIDKRGDVWIKIDPYGKAKFEIPCSSDFDHYRIELDVD